MIVFKVDKFVYVDESGVHQHHQRDKARAKRGVIVHAEKPGKRTKKTNVIAGLYDKKHIAVRCYEHSTTAAFFEEWFENDLLKVVPENSAIIMDNASFHRKNHFVK